ncbi:hypothetical protein KUV44_14350 [Marinobacter daepoensis]|uniref:Uncharacterized protein n=1 Tax=Marinobacter daepoensis TaxID=262077 RepID=A0ABS3BDN3_9GAMM|nr:hypothetical protein [Marinobacter daepoensis]MBN7769939.1 hypothetical protein [Marinobacter daepoensis]MBY6032636.1 hypothetical protein [Marinobacter daepoensis]MBY6080327.1 hypothetical protein [Marinobacter daepoensis]
MPFTRVAPVQAHRLDGLEWPGDGTSDRVCISIDSRCLARLMASHQLHAQDFSCQDSASQAVVRNLLLDLLRQN